MAPQTSQKANIVIVERFGKFDELFQERLKAKGYGSQNASSPFEAAKIASGLHAPLIIFEFGSDADNTKLGIEEILRVDHIKKYPILILGKDVNEYTSELKSHIHSFSHLDSPSKTAIVLERIDKIIARLDSHPTSVDLESGSNEGAYQSTQVIESGIHIHDVIFQELYKLKLSDKKIGGDFFVKIKHDGIEGKSILPVSSRVKNLILPLLEGVSPNNQRRFQRINFVCEQFAKALHRDEERVLCLSSLYARSFVNGSEEFLTREYFGLKRSGFRKELCSKIKDSALEIGFELQDKEITEQVSRIGKIIGEEEVIKGDEDTNIAIVLAADFLERHTVRRGHFSPRVAYDVIRKVKLGGLSWLPVPIACLVVKFLSEAIAVSTVKLLVTKKMKHDPDIQAKISKIIAEPLKEGEQHISLSDLSPGMHLTRPIHGFDGKEVLAGDLTLDEDLVFRIWQLATLRPLIEPTVKS